MVKMVKCMFCISYDSTKAYKRHLGVRGDEAIYLYSWKHRPRVGYEVSLRDFLPVAPKVE